MPVLILVVLVGAWLVSQWTPLFNSEARKIKKLAEELERPYREDKYGGKTPEETYDLFISALKAGNIELASRYFVIEKQKTWLNTLASYKEKDLLSELVFDLEKARKEWTKVESEQENFAQYEAKPTVVNEKTFVELDGNSIEVLPGNYSNFTQFEKYPSGVWKIYVL